MQRQTEAIQHIIKNCLKSLPHHQIGGGASRGSIEMKNYYKTRSIETTGKVDHSGRFINLN